MKPVKRVLGLGTDIFIDILLTNLKAKKLILTTDRNGCQPTSLLQTWLPFLLQSKNLLFHVRRELHSSYSDGKHLKMTNNHLRSAMMNIENTII